MEEQYPRNSRGNEYVKQEKISGPWACRRFYHWSTSIVALLLLTAVTPQWAAAAGVCDEAAARKLLQQEKPEAAAQKVVDCKEGSPVKGLVHHALYEGDQAILHLKKAFDAGNREDDVLLALADALLWKKDFRTSLRVMQEVKDTTSVGWLKVNARKHEFLGEFDRALALYEKVIPREKLPYGSMERKALLLSWNKDFDASIAEYTRILDSKVASEGQKLRCRIQRAEVMAWNKEFEKALVELDKVLSQQPGNAEAGLVKGRILEWSGRYSEAKKTYQEILNRNPGHEQAKLRLEKVGWAD